VLTHELMSFLVMKCVMGVHLGMKWMVPGRKRSQTTH
jgi:hypothetical protein